MQSRQNRTESPEALLWNLREVYATRDEWETDVRHVEEAISTVTTYQERLAEGAAVCLTCLRARDALQARLDKVTCYAGLLMLADATSPDHQALYGRAGMLAAEVTAALGFIQNEIAALPGETITTYLQEEPGLETYRRQIERVRARRDHMLSEETEAALAALGDTLDAPWNLYQQINAADVSFAPVRDAAGNEVPVSVGGFLLYLIQSPDRELRQQAWESLSAGIGGHKAALGTTLATFLQRNATLARLRRFDSTVDMHLSELQVPPVVYHNVLDILYDELAPHMRRLMRLRQRVLGLPSLHFCDVLAPLEPDYDPAYALPEAEQQIRAALASLGEEYSVIIATAFRDRWIDVADNVGKTDIPMTMWAYNVHPFIATVWHGRLYDVSVLAHELGHVVHGTLSCQNQIISNSEVGLFLLETPSTLNQLLHGLYLLEHATDPRLRRCVLQHLLDVVFSINMIFGLLEARFERSLANMADAHQPITTEVLMQVQGQLFEDFYGETLVVDERLKLVWALFPHFYYNPPRWATYVAGLAYACAIVEALRTEGPAAAERWVRALKAGGSLAPVDLMQVTGIDMTDPEPLRSAARLFGRLVTELEQSLD
ncbi:MAG TPA: M3 family metallopeptidase [Ktedonobacterales bacterium]|nr:M3 family metallopeptidase [Ktedonobacterales bacterium]